MEARISRFLLKHQTGTLCPGVHQYNDIRAALIASAVNETRQAKFNDTIYCNGMLLFQFKTA